MIVDVLPCSEILCQGTSVCFSPFMVFAIIAAHKSLGTSLASWVNKLHLTFFLFFFCVC